jgi:hypothetical protein
MPFIKTWLARIIIAIAGVWTIVSGAGDTTGNQVALIVTGIALLAFAVYATIRGLAGEPKGEDEQVMGLITPSKWYDLAVIGGLIVVVIIAWVAT